MILILVALSIGMGIFTFKALNRLNGEFTEDHIIISAIAGVVAFIIAIASNLIAFFITYFFDQKHREKRQDEAFDIIKEIERHTKKESIVLKSEDRKSLSQRGFFDNLYNNASDIRISGIKLTPLIEYIVCKEKKSGDNWVKKLRTRKHVIVRILISSPKSKVIPTLEKQEGLRPGAIINNIENSLKKLAEFSKSNKIKLAIDTSITIRVTDAIQNFNITYAGNTARQPTDKLLLGILFNKDDGPVYEILPTNVNTYPECLLLFDKLFENGTEVFHWNEYETKYSKIENSYENTL